MTQEIFEAAAALFAEAGNQIEGRPKRIEGKLSFTAKGTRNRLILGQNVTLKTARIQFLKDDGVIEIGDGVRHYGILIVGEGSTIKIGAGTRMNAATRIHAVERTTISIGQDCLLSDVRIRSSDMHSIIDLETRERINPAKDVVLEERVWVAEDVRIYKGVTIGSGSIVGARSTVTRDLPSNALCVGSPARAVKHGVSWDANRL